MITRAKLLKSLEKKRAYHASQLINHSNQLIEKGSAITRINAAISRERVRVYNEIIDLIIK